MTTPIAEVSFLDVGQGHATLVTAGGVSLLVDCPYGGSALVSEQLEAVGAEGLTGCVITHRDLDHCGGIRNVLDRFPAAELMFNPSHSVPAIGKGLPRVRSVIESILSSADVAGTRVRSIRRGESGTWGAIRWRALAPTDRMIHQATLDNNINRASIVLMLEISDAKFLITGDIDAPAVAELLVSGQDLRADVLLAPHHGAKIGNLSALVEAVSPSYGVVSVSRNAASHPSRDTLEELSHREGCRVMCTQVNRMCHPSELAESYCAGSIRFIVNPGAIEANPSQAVHGARIDKFASPICRVAAPSSTWD